VLDPLLELYVEDDATGKHDRHATTELGSKSPMVDRSEYKLPDGTGSWDSKKASTERMR